MSANSGSPRPRISVVVLAYRSSAEIGGALAALAAQDVDTPFETVVVWSGDEATPAIVAAAMPEARLVGGGARIPTGAGRNLGLRSARGEIVVFLAADCRPDNDWLRRRLDAHESGYAVVGGAVVHPPGAPAVAVAAHLLEYLDCSPARPREEVRRRPLYSLSFAREVFDRHGDYEDDLVCGEDTVFARRLAASGEVMLFDPSIRLVHPGPSTLGEFLSHQYRHGLWFGWLCRHRAAEIDPDGAFSSRSRFWSLYPLVRVVRGVRRLLDWERRRLLSSLLLSPLLLAGIGAASAGAARGYAMSARPAMLD